MSQVIPVFGLIVSLQIAASKAVSGRRAAAHFGSTNLLAFTLFGLTWSAGEIVALIAVATGSTSATAAGWMLLVVLFMVALIVFMSVLTVSETQLESSNRVPRVVIYSIASVGVAFGAGFLVILRILPIDM